MMIAFYTSQHRNLRSYHKARHWILILRIIGKTFCHRENVSAILPPDSHLSSCQPQDGWKVCIFYLFRIYFYSARKYVLSEVEIV